MLKACRLGRIVGLRSWKKAAQNMNKGVEGAVHKAAGMRRGVTTEEEFKIVWEMKKEEGMVRLLREAGKSLDEDKEVFWNPRSRQSGKVSDHCCDECKQEPY